jgi:serine/threonine protein kinase
MTLPQTACQSADLRRSTVVDTRAVPPDVGELVAGKYRIERMIGQGAMGVVFAATDVALGRRVAVKMMTRQHAVSPELASRFLNEARAAARIESEHSARIYDLGHTDSGHPYIALELLEGEDLAEVLASRERLPVHELTGWIVQALEAIAEAHSLGIVHRDLKPANLFLARRRDGTSIVKVLDFGISKDPSRVGPAITVTAAMVGSPAYMAPEQLRDARGVDARADIWALGVVLYELLSGTLPFDGNDLPQLCTSIATSEPIPLTQKRPGAPAELARIIGRCLEKDPARRYRNVAELAQELALWGPEGAAERLEQIKRVVREGGASIRPPTPPTSFVAPVPAFQAPQVVLPRAPLASRRTGLAIWMVAIGIGACVVAGLIVAVVAARGARGKSASFPPAAVIASGTATAQATETLEPLPPLELPPPTADSSTSRATPPPSAPPSAKAPKPPPPKGGGNDYSEFGERK